MSRNNSIGEAFAVAGLATGVVVGIVALVVVAVAGIWCAEAWLADAVYSNIFESAESGAPSINYWPMVGLVALVNIALGAIGRSAS